MARGQYLGYEIRYIPGKIPEYKVNGEWVTRSKVPERRAYEKKQGSTLEGFMQSTKNHIKERQKIWKKSGRSVLGDNEFWENKTFNKLMNHYNQQVERYGDICPITLVKFTTIRTHRTNKERMDAEKKYIFSNISVDRILDHINYTKQNTLFTAVGWNMSKGVIGLNEMHYLFKDEVIKRFKEIFIERFPDQAYKYL